MSILIAIPCYGGNISDSTANGLYKTAKYFDRIGIRNELLLVANESLISIGRSNIANFFMNNTEHDHIMCIDSDIGFEPEDIIDLLYLNVPFAAAPYSMKVVPPQYNFSLSGDRPIWNKAKTAVQVDIIGTGFQLIHRNVFAIMAKKYPLLKYVPVSKSRKISEKEKENSYHYYETYINSDGHALSEDFAFCSRWTALGGEIWMNPKIKLTHVGSHVFQGLPNLDDLLLEK